MDNCTECIKEGVMEFVFELEIFLMVLNIEDDSDSESDVETDTTFVQKQIRNFNEVVEDFKE